MAHNIQTAFYADEPAWHRLGVVVPGARTWGEAIELAGLDWEVEKQPLYDSEGNAVAWGTFRSDTNGFLGTVGDRYQPIQNREAFEFCDTLLEVGGAHYESAGALGRGERVWCLARLKGADFSVAKVDEHKAYLLFTTSHDGSEVATAKVTTVRVVCQNTLQMALKGAGQALRVRHTSNYDKKLQAAKAMITGATMTVKEVSDKLALLAKTKMTDDIMEGYLQKFFPVTDADSQIAITKRANKVQDLMVLVKDHDGGAFPKFKGTLYAFYNAVTRWADHHRDSRLTEQRLERGITEETARAESAIFGTASRFKNDTLDTLLQLAA